MRFKLILIAFVLSSVFLNAQNGQGKTDDFGRIAIIPYVVDQVENIPSSAVNNLQSKMAQILTKNGIAGSTNFPGQFIMVPNVSVLSKDVLASAPPKVVLTMEVAFYIGDGINGVKYGNAVVSLKGVGSNENKAYISAFKNIRSDQPELVALIEKSKNRILEYYNSGCDFIIKEAQNLAEQNEYEQAIVKLSAVPVVSKDCFNKSQDMIAKIYDKKINRDCEILLNKATNSWNAGQDYDSALVAAGYLNQIEPESKCFKQAKNLAKSIQKGIQRTNDKNWELLDKQLESITEIEKSRNETAKEIALAYANNLPKTVVYNVKGWW